MSRIQNQRESKIVDTKALMRRIFLKSPFKYLTLNIWGNYLLAILREAPASE
jgi:hypothetical protein